jgi:hypothetical protein
MIYHPPNTISITFDINGWLNGGQIEKVGVLLDWCLSDKRWQPTSAGSLSFSCSLGGVDQCSNVTRSEERIKIAPESSIKADSKQGGCRRQDGAGNKTTTTLKSLRNSPSLTSNQEYPRYHIPATHQNLTIREMSKERRCIACNDGSIICNGSNNSNNDQATVYSITGNLHCLFLINNSIRLTLEHVDLWHLLSSSSSTEVSSRMSTSGCCNQCEIHILCCPARCFPKLNFWVGRYKRNIGLARLYLASTDTIHRGVLGQATLQVK